MGGGAYLACAPASSSREASWAQGEIPEKEALEGVVCGVACGVAVEVAVSEIGSSDWKKLG